MPTVCEALPCVTPCRLALFGAVGNAPALKMEAGGFVMKRIAKWLGGLVIVALLGAAVWLAVAPPAMIRVGGRRIPS